MTQRASSGKKFTVIIARAYFLSSELEPDNLARAEAALKELNDLYDSQEDGHHSLATVSTLTRFSCAH